MGARQRGRTHFYLTQAAGHVWMVVERAKRGRFDLQYLGLR